MSKIYYHLIFMFSGFVISFLFAFTAYLYFEVEKTERIRNEYEMAIIEYNIKSHKLDVAFNRLEKERSTFTEFMAGE